MQAVAGTWGPGLPVGMWAWGRMVTRGLSGRALVASAGVAVRVCVGGLSDGVCVGLAVAWAGGLWCGWGSGLASVGGAGRWPRVDASGGVWDNGPGSPAGPRPGPVCGRMVPRGCSGRALALAVFVWLGMVLLPAGDVWRSQIAVAAWCCGWCCCAARLDAHSCRRLCGGPAPNGAGAPVVCVTPVVCGRCGEWTVAWGVEVDWLEDVEVFRLCRAPAPDGARARTFVALVAAVARDRGWVVIVAVLRVEVEELWCRAPPAIILPTAALPYVTGCGGGRSGCWARRATGPSLRGRGFPLHVRSAAISLSGAPLSRLPLRQKKSPQSLPWAPRTIPMAHSASLTSQPKVNGSQVVRMRKVARQLSPFMGPMGPQLSGRLPTGGRQPRGTPV